MAIETIEEEALRQLIEESYGVLAWLQGLVQLSDRARAYKVKKLAKALAATEACFTTSVAPDEPLSRGPLPRVP